MQAKKYKILSLDGGGCWALIQVMCLQKLFGEKTKGREVLAKFDLVAGNSGGSLVIAAMAENLGLDEIATFFRDEKVRKTIFSTYHTIWRPFYRIVGLGPKYSTDRKLKALKELLPSISKVSIFDIPYILEKDGSNRTHFFIASFDYNRQRAVFFRSNKESFGVSTQLADQLGIKGYGSSPDVSLTEAAHASSTAPINYFNEPAELKNCSSYFWDGGIAGYNNPILAATVEAIINGIDRNSVFVLSLGTGTKVFPIVSFPQTLQFPSLSLNLQKKEGLFSDVRKLATSILAAPPDAASYVSYTFLNPNHATNPDVGFDQFIRANPQLQPILCNNNWTLPDGLTIEEFNRLNKMDMDAICQKDIELLVQFCNLWLADVIPNQPIRIDANLQCLIGQNKFSEVMDLVSKYIA